MTGSMVQVLDKDHIILRFPTGDLPPGWTKNGVGGQIAAPPHPNVHDCVTVDGEEFWVTRVILRGSDAIVFAEATP